METPRDIRVTVDQLLIHKKELAGVGRWEPQDNDCRMVIPILLEGEVSDATLTIICFPREPELRFRMVLCYIRAIWRLDYTADETHVNPINRPDDLDESIITCPHYHSWSDNRRFSRSNSLPIKLLNARILPANVRTFPNAFRWFCGQTGIVAPDTVPDFPKSDVLL